MTTFEKLKKAQVKVNGTYTSCSCGSHYRYKGYCPYCQGSEERIIKAKKSLAMRYQKMGEGIHLGVELEMDGFETPTLMYETAWRIFTKVNYPLEPQLIEIEYDDTIPRGMELITQPLTLMEHQRKIPWKEVFQLIEEKGKVFSWNCDLHVHLDRYSEEFVKKLWQAVNHEFRYEFEALAKEKEIRKNYSDFEECDYEQRKDQRRVACNVKNKWTVEIRIFRQPKNYEELMAMLELTQKVVEKCLKAK